MLQALFWFKNWLNGIRNFDKIFCLYNESHRKLFYFYFQINLFDNQVGVNPFNNSATELTCPGKNNPVNRVENYFKVIMFRNFSNGKSGFDKVRWKNANIEQGRRLIWNMRNEEFVIVLNITHNMLIKLYECIVKITNSTMKESLLRKVHSKLCI